jgi:fibronectin-binding autotransporter adhesin
VEGTNHIAMTHQKITMKKNRGAATMILVFFFLFISITVLSGIVTPVVREFKVATNSLKSKQSYFASESGVEDAIYRLKNNKKISSTENLVLGTSTAATTITDIGNGKKEINSLGDTNSYQRKVDIVLSTSSGASFNYGVQVGLGGMDINSGTVNGNVYSNGPITGSSSAVITGTAISANSPALAADQSNDTGTPSYNITFGNAASTQDIAQGFQISTADNPVNSVSFYLKKIGSPSNATVKIVSDSNGTPGSTVLASGTLSASSVTASYGWITVSFSSNPVLDTGTTYWVVIDGGTGSSSNNYVLGANSAGYANGVSKIGQLGGTWNNTTPSGLDYFFNIYLGGITGSIVGSSGSQWNQLHVGTVSGTAQAHTVNYTNSTGSIYCQSGIGNNKSCTSQPDPIYVADPISKSNIEAWKSEALSGGVNNGDYTVPNGGASLGPKKIVGDLNVSSGRTLTVTGTLWVTGNITLNGGGTIHLASSYGSNDGVVVSDGSMEINGGGSATGSGTNGSYIMLLSTATGTAASVNGGAGAVIVCTPNGTLDLNGGASLKEANGYRITIGGGSTVTYESGLSDMNFSSGPSGSWSVSSWKEVQ